MNGVGSFMKPSRTCKLSSQHYIKN
jgi:hypothetical protein